MAEMYMHPMPLFYGASEKEVFVKICTTLGSPNKNNWSEGVNQASKIGIKYPQSPGTDLANIVIGASPDAIDVMKQMLQWSPNARATAATLLRHPFFSSCGYDLRVTNTNFFNDFGDVKAFNKTNRRFRPFSKRNIWNCCLSGTVDVSRAGNGMILIMRSRSSSPWSLKKEKVRN